MITRGSKSFKLYIYISIDLSCFPLFLPQVFQTWIAGDINLDLELQSAISEKSPQFGFGDLTVFKDLVQEHVSISEKKMAALGKSGPTIQAAQLERQAFDISLQGLVHQEPRQASCFLLPRASAQASSESASSGSSKEFV